MAYGVRHGTTKANVNDEFRGWEEFELDDQGVNEAHEAAEWFLEHGVKPTRIISSPLSRALKTAEIIGQALGVKVDVDERLKPLNVGEYTGKDKDKSWDEFVQYLDNPDEPIPDGESVNGFADREIEALEEHLGEAATHGPIILVWHTSNCVVADCYLRTGDVGMDCRPEEKDIVAPGGIVAISPTRNIWPVFKNVKEEEEEKEPEKAKHEEYDDIQEKGRKRMEKLHARTDPDHHKAAGSPLDAFMKDFFAGTYSNPFNPRERVLGEDAIIELRPFDDKIHLSFIRSVERGAGGGSKALDWLCSLADKHGVAMDLDAKPVGKGLNKSQLIKWYVSRGFDRQKGEGMVRQPKG